MFDYKPVGVSFFPHLVGNPCFQFEHIDRIREQYDKRVTKAKRTIRAKPKHQIVFHPFPRLPAELRAKIWAIVVEDQIVEVLELCWPTHENKNYVVIHEHEEKDGKKQLSVVTMRGYPTLFSVNREARYEAAKVDRGTWYALGVGSLEVYANLARERVCFAKCCSNPGLVGTPLRAKEFRAVHCIHDMPLGGVKYIRAIKRRNRTRRITSSR